MLENLLNSYNNWIRLGENMSKRPVSYFQNSGEYAGWLRTRAWFEIQIANCIDLESESNVFGVKPVKKEYLKAVKL